MFEKKDSFSWKIPVLILVGVLVLSSGIYVGIKTRDSEEKDKTDKTVKINTEKENNTTKQVFELSEDCEIWVEKKYEGNSSQEPQSIMIGTIPNDLLNKSQGEIIAYLEDKYPERSIEKLGKNKIVLSENVKKDEPSKANKYTLENDEGFIGLYRYDSNAKGQLIEKTQIKIDSLPKTVQDEIKKGVIVETQDEAYSKLEDFGS